MVLIGQCLHNVSVPLANLRHVGGLVNSQLAGPHPQEFWFGGSGAESEKVAFKPVPRAEAAGPGAEPRELVASALNWQTWQPLIAWHLCPRDFFSSFFNMYCVL